MQRLLLATASAASIIALAGCGSTSSSQAVIKTVTVTAGAAATAPASDPVPEVSTVEPAPDGRITFRCNYILGDFTSGTSTGYRFVADVTVKNTGNIGTVSKVTAIWDQIGVDPVKKTKTVKTGAGKSKKVGFTVPASQEQIDLHQAAGGECRVRSAIADTFGEAR